MIHIKKTTIWRVLGGLGLLAAVMTAALLLAPAVVAQYDPCGDGICDTSTENSDLCIIDCPCTDNGVADPGEGCSCRDVICEGEKLRSACGTPCGEEGECPEGLACFREVCWEDCACEGRCTACRGLGRTCESGAECCSMHCNGTCYCLATGPGPCESDSECCSGICTNHGGGGPRHCCTYRSPP